MSLRRRSTIIRCFLLDPGRLQQQPLEDPLVGETTVRRSFHGARGRVAGRLAQKELRTDGEDGTSSCWMRGIVMAFLLYHQAIVDAKGSAFSS